MSTTSLHLATPELPRPQAQAHARRPAAPRPTPMTGRFRGDLTTEQWWWSPELFELHGIPSGSVQPTVGLLLAHVHGDDRPALQQALREAATTAAPFTREYRVLRLDGRPLTALLVCEPETDAAGAVIALTGLVVDVTAERTHVPADEQLRQLETEVEQLRSAMASRAAIEQAKGILMLLMSCGDQVAFDLLAHISSHTHRKVRDVAAVILESASGGSPLPADVRAILHDACPPGRAAV